uniref:DUF7210 domain-containing protein n=1 Tax=Myoviridae sp. ctRci5 TaxID=2825105 RepID=A0A8S5V6C1_9CAUD|nr:MAG TPA: hypothetical protein [Myoviridae sp. ctRci5]
MKIRAIKPFTHTDRSFAVGDVVDASNAAGKWLIEQGVAVEVAAEAKEAKERPKPA